MTDDMIPGANGSLTLNLGWKGGFYTLTVFGGPYDRFPNETNDYGVCVRAERAPKNKLHMHVPIMDFSIPIDDENVRLALREAFRAAIDGKRVYVGCMGGYGRTGLFLALMAKVAGVEDPVRYVRRYYSTRAVETVLQEEYVEMFDVTQVRQEVRKYAWRKRFRFA